MLRKREETQDITNIQNQIKDLRDELNSLKNEIKIYKLNKESSINKFNTKNPKENKYNQQLIKQFTKIITNSLSTPRSFGKI